MNSVRTLIAEVTNATNTFHHRFSGIISEIKIKSPRNVEFELWCGMAYFGLTQESSFSFARTQLTVSKLLQLTTHTPNTAIEIKESTINADRIGPLTFKFDRYLKSGENLIIEYSR